MQCLTPAASKTSLINFNIIYESCFSPKSCVGAFKSLLSITHGWRLDWVARHTEGDPVPFLRRSFGSLNDPPAIHYILSIREASQASNNRQKKRSSTYLFLSIVRLAVVPISIYSIQPNSQYRFNPFWAICFVPFPFQ